MEDRSRCSCQCALILSVPIAACHTGVGLPKTQFVEVVRRRLAVVDSIEEVRQMFRAFDRGCRGFITRGDMRKVRMFFPHDLTSYR